jgi:hypothetical protein
MRLHTNIQRRRQIVFLGALAMAVLTAGPAHADRLTDSEVKQLIEAVDNARDRFEDQLDGKLKNSVIRSSKGEANVRQYLEDYQETVKNLKDRFTSQYSGSAEAQIVFQQATSMHRFLEGYDKQIKGRSEFDHLATQLGKLAGAYGVSFPLTEGATARRYNDDEVAGMAEVVAKDAEQLKKAIDKDAGIPKGDRKAAKDDLDLLKKQAEVVKSRVSDGKPATAEARDLFTQSTRVGTFVGGRQLASSTTAAWGSLRAHLESLRVVFDK